MTMTDRLDQPSGVHLAGSVPLNGSGDVFRMAVSILGERLRRVPDGETGIRSYWIGWQSSVFKDHPLFEAGASGGDAYRTHPQFGLLPSATVGELVSDNLGYAEAAKNSYGEFSRLKSDGLLPQDLRFQVSLPTPLAPVTSFVAPSDRAAVEPAYETALLNEFNDILGAVPHRELAVQWGVAVEFSLLEGMSQPHFDDLETGIAERLTRLGAKIPEDVELGYHLCFGDAGHKHFKEPEDASRLTEIANSVLSGIARSVNWLHLPVPGNRTDDAYFEPLTGLHTGSKAELYLGLVHMSDGVEGTRRRIETAKRHVGEFGAATECGFGRRPPETVPELMRIHAAVSNVR